jgi:hypothetical protein
MAIVKSCTIWTNGIVMSFDEKGEQIPGYQGFILDIAEKLKIGCDENTKWTFGNWSEWLHDANLNWYWTKDKQDNTQDNKQKDKQDSMQNNKKDST